MVCRTRAETLRPGGSLDRNQKSQVAAKAERAESGGTSSAGGLCRSSTAAVTHAMFWFEASTAVKWTNQVRGLQRFGGESGCQLLAAIVFED